MGIGREEKMISDSVVKRSQSAFLKLKVLFAFVRIRNGNKDGEVVRIEGS